MLLNPFTPSAIAAGADQFFGRHEELNAIENSLPVGSVLVQGPIGIGKSSLLARALDLMASNSCDTKIVVADAEIVTVEDAAKLILDSLVDFNQRDRKFRIKFGLKTFQLFEPSIELESQAARDFNDGRHLAALKRIIESDYARRRNSQRNLLVIGIDEGDKATVAITRLIRSLWTHCQQVGVDDVRFALAGVSPIQQRITQEDSGVMRAFNRVITLAPIGWEASTALLSKKFNLVIADARAKGQKLSIDPTIPDRIANLSGGHPHILQLLGSHLVQHENEYPDKTLDTGDLVGALRRICYNDRGVAYAATLHMIENAGKLSALTTLLNEHLIESSFPTKIGRTEAIAAVGDAHIQWLVEHTILVPRSSVEYGLVDEFLRVRLAFDATEPALQADVENEMIEQGRIIPIHEVSQDELEEGMYRLSGEHRDNAEEEDELEEYGDDDE